MAKGPKKPKSPQQRTTVEAKPASAKVPPPAPAIAPEVAQAATEVATSHTGPAIDTGSAASKMRRRPSPPAAIKSPVEKAAPIASPATAAAAAPEPPPASEAAAPSEVPRLSEEAVEPFDARPAETAEPAIEPPAPEIAPEPPLKQSADTPVIQWAEAEATERVEPVVVIASVEEVLAEMPPMAPAPTRSAEAILSEPAAREAHAPLSSYAVTVRGFAEINARAIDALQANSLSMLEYLDALFGARSFSEAISMQAEHARRQFEVMNDQAKQLTDLTRRVLEEASRPLTPRLASRK